MAATVVTTRASEAAAEEALASPDWLRETVRRRLTPGRPKRSVKGLLAGMGYDVTPEDIAEVRREMWGNVGRRVPDAG